MAGKFDAIGSPQAVQGSMSRAGPNTPAWWSDTGPSWNPETGLDIYGNYGGPIGTSGPMGAGVNPRGNAQNIAYGLDLMNPAGQPETTELTGMPQAAIGGNQATPQQNMGYAPQPIGAGLFGGKFQMMQQPPFYNPLMGLGGAQNFGGLFGQQLQPMMQYRMGFPGLNTQMQQPNMIQQQFNQQAPAFFDSLAYRPL